MLLPALCDQYLITLAFSGFGINGEKKRTTREPVKMEKKKKSNCWPGVITPQVMVTINSLEPFVKTLVPENRERFLLD